MSPARTQQMNGPVNRKRKDDSPCSTPSTFSSRMLARFLTGMRRGRLTFRESGGEWSVGEEFAPETVVQIHHPRAYRQMLWGGSLGAAQSYIDGEWSTDSLTQLFQTLLRNRQKLDQMNGWFTKLTKAGARVAHFFRRNTRNGSRKNIQAHYDLGNEFFELLLDPTMMYSSGIFETPASTLEEASHAKIERLCRKLDLKPGDELLEIGTGWGGFAIHAAKEYGCKVTTTTISKEQYEYARTLVQAAGLENRITLLQNDYRDLTGQYDKLISIEMIEAVGERWIPVFLQKCDKLLKPDGIMALQSITMSEARYESYRKSVDFIQRYVFPGGFLPTVSSLLKIAGETSSLRLLHMEDFSPHYARTLECWRENFQGELEQIRAWGYSEEFLRLWNYYLCYCEAAFNERAVGVAQLLFAKHENRLDSVSVTAPLEQETVWGGNPA